MSKYLLDVNVLIALIDPLHVHHDRAHAWFRLRVRDEWFSSPSTQNGVLRITSHPRYPNHQPIKLVITSLRSLLATSRHRFIPDDLSIVTESTPELIQVDQLNTTSQITDTYLLGLAISNRAHLATFDTRLQARTVVGGPEAIELIP